MYRHRLQCTSDSDQVEKKPSGTERHDLEKDKDGSSLAGVGLAFALIGLALGLFDPFHLRAFPQRIYGNIMEMDKAILVAVPLFVFMGVMLEKSRIAEQLLDAMGPALRPGSRAGLSVSSNFSSASVSRLGPHFMPSGFPMPSANSICALFSNRVRSPIQTMCADVSYQSPVRLSRRVKACS